MLALGEETCSLTKHTWRYIYSALWYFFPAWCLVRFAAFFFIKSYLWCLFLLKLLLLLLLILLLLLLSLLLLLLFSGKKLLWLFQVVAKLLKYSEKETVERLPSKYISNFLNQIRTVSTILRFICTFDLFNQIFVPVYSFFVIRSLSIVLSTRCY